MGVQTITTPAGEEMIVMSRAEYEALLAAAEEAFEDGADMATYNAAIAAASPQDILPSTVSAAILAGTGRLRAMREWRGQSLEALSLAVAAQKEVLEEIERGARLLDRELAARISQALGIPPGWLAP